MKKVSNASYVLKYILVVAVLICTTFQTFGQQARPANSGYATANGTKVYYEIYGEGRPVILLHGAFCTIQSNWGEIIPELSKSRKVIAIEFQGHGHTPYSDRKLDIVSLAKDVEGVLDYLKIDSADVAGYSMGGSIAYQFAVQSPERLRKLVIISSTYKTKGWLPVVYSAFKNFTPEVFDHSPMKAAYDAVAPDTTKWSMFIKQMIDFAKVSFDCGEANIAKIKSPVLIIAGDNDGLDKVELMKTYQLLGGGVPADIQPMPASHLAIVPSQGHVSVMMQTATILGYLEDFLK